MSAGVIAVWGWIAAFFFFCFWMEARKESSLWKSTYDLTVKQVRSLDNALTKLLTRVDPKRVKTLLFNAYDAGLTHGRDKPYISTDAEHRARMVDLIYREGIYEGDE